MANNEYAFYLFRHGETEATEKRLYCGKTDLPLSEKGRRQIIALAKMGLYPFPAPERLYTSGLARTMETLSLIYPDKKAFPVPELNEMDFGRFEMHGYEKLVGDMDYIDWISDLSGAVPCPEGESAKAFTRRVTDGFEHLLWENGDRLAVLHGGVIARLLLHLFPDRALTFYDVHPRPGEGFKVYFADGRPVSYEPVKAKE